MRIGVVFPQTEIGGDVGAVRAYAQGVEELGFTHLLAYDHVVGADPSGTRGLDRPLRRRHHVPRAVRAVRLPGRHHPLELVTGIIILPQRQTVLVAKQAAEVDLLTRRAASGSASASAGTRWSTRRSARTSPTAGTRLEEQVALLRRLWTERVGHVSTARSSRSPGAGLAPMPVQRPIPVWFGGSLAAAYAALGRLADGWFPQVPPGPEAPRLPEPSSSNRRASAGRCPGGVGDGGTCV